MEFNKFGNRDFQRPRSSCWVDCYWLWHPCTKAMIFFFLNLISPHSLHMQFQAPIYPKGRNRNLLSQVLFYVFSHYQLPIFFFIVIITASRSSGTRSWIYVMQYLKHPNRKQNCSMKLLCLISIANLFKSHWIGLLGSILKKLRVKIDWILCFTL